MNQKRSNPEPDIFLDQIKKGEIKTWVVDLHALSLENVHVDKIIAVEVFNGADHFFSEKISKRIKNLIASSGAVLFISHSHDLILEVCNRAIVIHDKKIIFDGAPGEAIHYYKENCYLDTIQNG